MSLTHSTQAMHYGRLARAVVLKLFVDSIEFLVPADETLDV